MVAGVFRSTDNGANWEIVNDGLNDGYSKEIYSLVINSNDCILINTYYGPF